MDASTRFHKAYNYTIVNEGLAFVNNPDDKGGPTKMGITLTSLTAFWKTLGKSRVPTASDVAALTVSDAQDFYNRVVWPSVQGDVWSCDGLGMALFDCATLMGAPQTIRYLQQSAWAQQIVIDGVLGPKTIAQVQSLQPSNIICSMSAAMGKHCVALAIKMPTQQKFLSTWALRAGRMLTLALDTERTHA